MIMKDFDDQDNGLIYLVLWYFRPVILASDSMADSDDEYDKKFRDKFRGERDRADSAKGFDNRRDERRPPRDDWIERFVFEAPCQNS